jgi:hypothetical protein
MAAFLDVFDYDYDYDYDYEHEHEHDARRTTHEGFILLRHGLHFDAVAERSGFARRYGHLLCPQFRFELV